MAATTTARTPPTGAPPAGAREHVPRPFARWPRAADGVLAVLLLVVASSVTDGPGDSVVLRSALDVPLPVLLLFVVASVAVAGRRRAPLPVLTVVLVAWALTLGSGFADLGAHALVALYTAGRYGADDRRGLVGVAGALLVLTLDGVLESVPWGETAFGLVVVCLVWDTGRRLRVRAERRRQLLREREAETRRIVVEERTRIARELHDVVAHRVSLMTVQAGAAKTVAGTDLAAAVRAMGAVEAAGRQALDELRHLLGVLRPDAPLDATGPQPGLGDLPQLVEQTRQAGIDVTLDAEGLPPDLPARVELSAYRIVQEGLTNVVKHAGPDVRAKVRLSFDGAALTVEVVDDGRGATVLPASGHGLVGMRERALLLGGTLDVGPRPEGGFRVSAQLPLTGVPA